ncbi:MAG: type IV toxin-antitoxin system AbiEi family antitoxin domain-containing protein [Nocardioides sp.]
MDTDTIARLLDGQSGVISRRQVLAGGGHDADIARLLRRRIWCRTHHGVYVDHTGPLTWEQRAWAAVLYYWPAALDGDSALRAYGVRRSDTSRRDDEPVRVVISADRWVARLGGVSVRRIVGFHDTARLDLSPPRVGLEHAVLTCASSALDEAGAVAVLGDAVQTRRTTAERLLVALGLRARLRRRDLMRHVLDDVAGGAYSVLERRYLHEVERRHGLPDGRRQQRVEHGGTVAFRDVEYAGLGTVVELDGRLGHERARDRWADLARDVAAATAGDLTIRVGWGQVLDGCRLAAAVATILAARGWHGTPVPCAAGCPIASINAGNPSPAA